MKSDVVSYGVTSDVVTDGIKTDVVSDGINSDVLNSAVVWNEESDVVSDGINSPVAWLKLLDDSLDVKIASVVSAKDVGVVSVYAKVDISAE